MKFKIPIVLYRDSDIKSEYKAIVPDFSHITTTGDSIEHALVTASYAVHEYVNEAHFKESDILKLFPIEKHLENSEFADSSSWAEIEVDLSAVNKYRYSKS